MSEAEDRPALTPASDPRGLAAGIARARRYPFDRPSRSYLFAHGAGRPLDPDELPRRGRVPPAFAGRTPVLAYASNAAPDALARKFAEHPKARIPVTACTLAGFDAVYSRHFSRGYIPATLTPAAETILAAWLTWLAPAELAPMDASEQLGLNYELKPLDGAGVRLANGFGIPRPLTYRGLHGELRQDGKPIAVTGVPARKRRLTELDQDGILELVRGVIAPESTLEQMIAVAVTSGAGATRLTESLKRAFPD